MEELDSNHARTVLSTLYLKPGLRDWCHHMKPETKNLLIEALQVEFEKTYKEGYDDRDGEVEDLKDKIEDLTDRRP